MIHGMMHCTRRRDEPRIIRGAMKGRQGQARSLWHGASVALQ